MRTILIILLIAAASPGLRLAQSDSGESDECTVLIDEMFADQNSLEVPQGDENQDELLEGYLQAMALRQEYEDIDADDCSDVGFSGPRVASYFAGVQDAFALLLFQELAPEQNDNLQEHFEETQERIDTLGRELIFGLF